MMKKIHFLQDIESHCKEKDSTLNTKLHNSMNTWIDEAIRTTKKEMSDLLELSKKHNLCLEEKEQIEEFIKQRIGLLMERKTRLIEIGQRVSHTEADKDPLLELEKFRASLNKR
jgi:hypothetical protein